MQTRDSWAIYIKKKKLTPILNNGKRKIMRVHAAGDAEKVNAGKRYAYNCLNVMRNTVAANG